jgi:hypothetical protein
VTDGGRDEVAGDQFRSLVNQLIKGVLPVGAGFAPDNRAGLPARRSAVPVNIFSVAILTKEIRHMDTLHLPVMGFQVFPGSGFSRIYFWQHPIPLR